MPSTKKAIMVRPSDELYAHLESIRSEVYNDQISMSAVVLLMLEAQIKSKPGPVDRILNTLLERFTEHYKESKGDFEAGRVDGVKAVIETLEMIR